MTHEAAESANEPRPPGVAAVEGSLERTQDLLAQFREEVERLLLRVRHDVDQLREAALGEPGPLPWADPAGAGEARAERQIAEIVGQEQAILRTRALVNEVIDERFRNLNELIQQARLRQGAGSARALRENLRGGASRRKP